MILILTIFFGIMMIILGVNQKRINGKVSQKQLVFIILGIIFCIAPILSAFFTSNPYDEYVIGKDGKVYEIDKKTGKRSELHPYIPAEMLKYIPREE